jgi:hypothetical protein
MTPYSGSIDNLVTVSSTSSPRDGGCLDFLEEGICRVGEREDQVGRDEIPVMRLSGLAKTPRGFRAYINLSRFDFLRPIALSIHTTARVEMPIQKVTTLNTGATMPLIGLGTFFSIRASHVFFPCLLQGHGSQAPGKLGSPLRPHSRMVIHISIPLQRMVSPVNKPFSLKSVHVRLSHWPDNEKEVGQGIKASGVPRSKIFLTTKLNNIDHEDVLGALNNSLELLGTDYVDLCAGLSPTRWCGF